MELAEVDVYDPDNFVDGVPHEMFATLRREAPVFQHPMPNGKHFWCVTRHDDLVTVNRDSKTFSSWLGGATLNMKLPPISPRGMPIAAPRQARMSAMRQHETTTHSAAS